MRVPNSAQQRLLEEKESPMCDSKEDDVLEKMLLHFEKDRQEYMSDQMQWIKAALYLRADLEQVRKKSTVNSVLIACLAVLVSLLAILK